MLSPCMGLHTWQLATKHNCATPLTHTLLHNRHLATSYNYTIQLYIYIAHTIAQCTLHCTPCQLTQLCNTLTIIWTYTLLHNRHSATCVYNCHKFQLQCAVPMQYSVTVPMQYSVMRLNSYSTSGQCTAPSPLQCNILLKCTFQAAIPHKAKQHNTKEGRGPMERGAGYGEASKHGTLPMYTQEGVAHRAHSILCTLPCIYTVWVLNWWVPEAILCSLWGRRRWEGPANRSAVDIGHRRRRRVKMGATLCRAATWVANTSRPLFLTKLWQCNIQLGHPLLILLPFLSNCALKL